MRFSWGERRVKISVGEFAGFRLQTASTQYPTNIARLQQGTQGHQQLQAEVAQKEPKAEFEITLQASYVHRGWTFEIHGRLDQCIHNSEATLIREVKTTNRQLPYEEETLVADYPHYFNQLAAYLILSELQQINSSECLKGELYFINITQDSIQTVGLTFAEAKELFEFQLDRLIPFLESRWNSRQKLSALQFSPAFEIPREGQVEVLEQLHTASTQAQTLLFEAPTGFGKTGTVVQYALEQLRNGIYSRIIYLTSKSTGQLQVIDQLKNMIQDSHSFAYYQLRNKKEHCNICSLRNCNGQESCYESSFDPELLELDPEAHLINGSLTLNQLGMLSTEKGICPYALSKSTLTYTDFWVCDYNYIFSPDNQNIFENQLEFSPQETLLIVDEAHNLPSRVNEAYSCIEKSNTWLLVQEELHHEDYPPQLVQALGTWADFIEHLKPCDKLATGLISDTNQIVENLLSICSQIHIQYESLTHNTRECLSSVHRLKSILSNATIEKHFWVPQTGELRITCIDAAVETAATLDKFATNILMSATLSPLDYFRDQLGQSVDQTRSIYAPADWRNEAYNIAIDTRINTQFKDRANHYITTSRTIQQMIQQTTAPLVVFFPSYQYAETIKTYLEAENSFINVTIQPRKANLHEQIVFIEESLLTAQALFCVLGSNFSESIDHLGGKIELSMVVGPALPEVNPIQKAKMQYFAPESKEAAFEKVYQIPALQKTNQALGRLVRSPGQTTKVLLHCQRFAEPSYLNLLAPEYSKPVLIHTENALLHWLIPPNNSISQRE